MKPTLLILAAGMGSRYGGLKQIDGIGPNEEPIIEYSIYDAINSGFGKIVFVIRREFDEAFRNRFDKFKNKIIIEYTYQEVNPKVEGIITVERTKPWGTSHAVLVAKDVINEPFAVINADDYYGSESYKLIADFLTKECSPSLMAMIGYTLHNTLSEHGTVNRGVCELDSDNNLVEVIERTKIAEQNGVVNYNIGAEDPLGEVDRNSSVSMNYWGFHPSIFEEIEKGLHNFMRENPDNPTAEYYIPNIITDMIISGQMSVCVIPTNDNWFGVTYKEDKPMAIESINRYIEEGIYPKNLWS
ncbi:MAG: nucleotidyltransferase [Flavobacteriales bacterium]|jgi:UTP-glucose-1-phosphate uridylyltransferase|nr:nucleotidyltransferase [Flavobacteriales bacterium]MBT6808098.1 nucleotidyltransferase [Flavobacteriales bacterium]